MATSADLIYALLVAEPGLSVSEIYGEVQSITARFARLSDVERVLKLFPSRFECRDDLWYACAPEPPATVAAHPGPTMAELDPASGLEHELRTALRGRRLVAEIGVSAELHEEVTAALEIAVRRTRDHNDLRRRYPALLATYLVGHGVYHYSQGNYWGTIDVDGVNQAIGPAFEQALKDLHLETFEDMVFDDKALRYVSPVLAHGGVPKNCLDDFFQLLLRTYERGATDAAEVISNWRTTKTSFVGVDAPVRRFLLRGGQLAVDLLDRCLDMVREHARSATIARPDDVGLPPYILVAYSRWVIGRPPPPPPPPSPERTPKPVVRFDPWDAVGPVAVLPAVPSDVSTYSWHLLAEGQSAVRPASTWEEIVIGLAPARSWQVELVRSGEIVRQSAFEGLDRIRALVFDPATTALIPASTGIRATSVWVLCPADVELAGIDEHGNQTPIDAVEELPTPTGKWSGFDARWLDVSTIRALVIRTLGGETRLSVRAPLAAPHLKGPECDGVTTVSGTPVRSAMPELVLPGDDLSLWTVRVRCGSTTINLPANKLERGVDGYRLPEVGESTGLRSIDLVVAGPLGSDLRTSFVVVPGLSVARPRGIIRPESLGQSVTVVLPSGAVNGHPVRADISLPEIGTLVPFTCAFNGDELGLTCRIHRLEWSLALNEDSVAASSRTQSLPINDLVDSTSAALFVHTGVPGTSIRLRLTDGTTELQSTAWERTNARDGRWRFDLKRFVDTVLASELLRPQLVLDVGIFDVPVVRLSQSLLVNQMGVHVRRIDGDAHITLSFEEARRVRGRTLRLRNLDSPWENITSVPIPDDIADHFAFTAERAPSGEYLLDLVVDDGWTTMPALVPGLPNSVTFSIGTQSDLVDELYEGDHGSPSSVRNLATVLGRRARLLDIEEHRAVAADLVVALEMLCRRPTKGDIVTRRLATTELLMQHPISAMRALADALQAERLTTNPLFDATLAEHVRPIAALLIDVERARTLWTLAPATAAFFDLGLPIDDERSARIREFVGWDPDATSMPHSGQAPTQAMMGIPAEQLALLQRSVALVPRQALDLDTFASACFEWLRHEKSGPGISDTWLRRWQRAIDATEDWPPTAAAALAALAPQRGTAAAAALPRALLSCALAVRSRRANSTRATEALLDAAAFAPKLVTYSYIYAQAVLMSAEV